MMYLKSILILSLATTGLSPDLENQVKTDLNVLASMKGNAASPLNSAVFGGTKLDGLQYLAFFQQRVTSFGQDSCGGPPTVACVYWGTHIMQITPSYTTFGMPQIERISTMIHESRHTERENGYWKHVSCPIPFKDQSGQDIRGHDSHTLLQGLMACDRNLLGAYGVEAIFLKNVARFCDNCTAKIKMDAAIYGESFSQRIIDPAAVQQLGEEL